MSGARVYLYATSTTANAGPATALLSNPAYVLSDANGNFSIPAHTCPVGAFVYVLALGGNPGLAAGTNNTDLALAAGMGSCGVAQTATVNIDEVTTVATAFALTGYASTETSIGANIASTPDAVNLGDGFATIPNLVDLPSGLARSATLDGTGVVPQATINSLADSLAPCINSDGTGSACSALMNATSVNSVSGTPVDTFQAVVNIAKSPGANVASIYAFAAANAPFQPTLATAPASWAIAISYPGGAPTVAVSLNPSAASIPQYGAQDFVATLTGTSAPDYSYQWTAAGGNGTLVEDGDQQRTGQTTYCSTSNVATYQPNASPNYSAAADTVSVQVFSGPGCAPTNLLGQSPSASVALQQPTGIATPSVPQIPTTTFTGTVTLPAGIALTPSQLTVLTTIGSVTPSANGSFTVPVYATGPQIAIVAAPSGNPMMLGWLDSTHSAITAGTTAEILAYYAMGGAAINNAVDRQQMEALVAASPGLPSLTQVLTTEIVANPNGFTQLDSNVKAALNSYFTSITNIVPMLEKPEPGGPSAHNILVNPSPSTTQSGQSVQQQPPFEANISNNYRRHATAFVTRVSDAFTPGVQQDPQNFGQVDVPPANGVSGDIFATLGDMFSAYYGNQPTAYAAVTTDNFSIPLTANSQDTTYNVTIVGPGAANAVSNGLTSAQATAQVQVAVGGFTTDALIPFFANFMFGSSFLINGNGAGAAQSAFAASFRNDLTTDILNFLTTTPTLQTQITSGQWGQAMQSLLNTALSSGTLQNLLVNAADKAAGANLATTGFAKAISSFVTMVQMAGGVLQVFDSAVYVSQVGSSNAADQWTVDVTPQKVTLSPATSNLQQTGAAGTGSQTLTVALPGVTSLSGYSYLFTNTANAGDISATQGIGKGGSFCTPSSSVYYITRAIPILTVNTTDTVTVQAFQGPLCNTANLVGNASAVVTVQSTGVVLNPAAATVTQQGPEQVGLTASVASSLPTAASYQWTLNGTQGSSPVGTLTEVGGSNRTGQISYCSVSPSATYIANLSPSLSSTANDQVTVQAFTGASCAAGTGTSIATSLPSLITVTSVSVLLQPIKPALQQDQQITMTATTQGTLSTTTYSYRWTTTTNAGTLMEIGGTGQTGATYCSTSLQANYIPNNTPVLASPVTDIVSVQVFSGAGCVTTNAVSGTASTPVQVRPVVTISSTVIPAPIFLQAGDGFYYGIGTQGSGVSFLVQYNPDLSIHKTISLPAGVMIGYFNFRAPLIGPDGNLYGYSTSGNYRVALPSGTVTVLNTGTTGMILTVLANDGYFYGYTGYGYQALDPTKAGVFSRMDMNGNVSPISPIEAPGTCTANDTNCNFIYGSLQASDGNLYALAGNYLNVTSSGTAQLNCSVPQGEINSISTSGSFNFVASFNNCYSFNGGLALSQTSNNLPIQNSLIEGPDSALYGITQLYGAVPVYVTGSLLGASVGPYSTIFREQGGLIQPLYELPHVIQGNSVMDAEGSEFDETYGLIPGSDGNLYGATHCFGGGNIICNSILFQVSTTGTFFPMYTFGQSAGISAYQNAPTLQNSTGALMGFYTYYDVNDNPTITEFVSSLSLPAPIQLTLSNPGSGAAVTSVQANNPVQLTWKVLNAFSLSAQQCVAQIQTFPTGAGSWTGLQVGTTSTDPNTSLPVYGASKTLTPTTPGTYTYALTCGGYESGYATLQVTP